MSREQKLIDIVFEVALTIRNSQRLKNHTTQDELAEWVAKQLRECGFDTKPVGSSWGVLTGDRQDRE